MNEAIFKTTVMGGFSKNEVLKFIDKQDEQFKEREKDLFARINKLNGELMAESQHNTELSVKISELETQLEKEKTKNAEEIKRMRDTALSAEQAKNDFGKMTAKNDAEIDSLRKQVVTLTYSLDSAKAEAEVEKKRVHEYEEKLKLIDKTEDQIGRALLEAQKTADKITDAAKAEANRIEIKARTEANALNSAAEDRVRLIFCEASRKLNALLCGVEDYKKRIEEIRSQSSAFFTSADSIFSTLYDTAQNVADKFNVAIKTADEADALIEEGQAELSKTADSKNSEQC
jgi:cell division septum initiation protein DivIVA